MGVWQRADNKKRSRIQRAWASAYAKLSNAKAMWQCVRGPMTATIAPLIDAKWTPIEPANWITPETSGSSISNAGSSKQLASFMEDEGQAAKEIIYRLEEDLESKL